MPKSKGEGKLKTTIALDKKSRATNTARLWMEVNKEIRGRVQKIGCLSK